MNKTPQANTYVVALVASVGFTPKLALSVQNFGDNKHCKKISKTKCVYKFEPRFPGSKDFLVFSFQRKILSRRLKKIEHRIEPFYLFHQHLTCVEKVRLSLHKTK